MDLSVVVVAASEVMVVTGDSEGETQTLTVRPDRRHGEDTEIEDAETDGGVVGDDGEEETTAKRWWRRKRSRTSDKD